MRRRLGSVVFVSVLALITSGCGGGQGETNKDEIPIGVDIELSGPAQVQGSAYRNALNLVTDEVNKDGVLGGRKIRLVIQDNRSAPETAAQVGEQLIDSDKVVALIGGGDASTTLPLIPAVEQRGVPTISLATSGDIAALGAPHKYVFTTPPSTKAVVARMVAEFKDRGYTKIGLLAGNDSYGIAGEQALVAASKAAGIQVVRSEKFTGGATDYSFEVQKVIEAEPQAIAVWSVPPFAGQVANNIRGTEFNGKVYYAAAAGAELFVKDAGRAAEGAFMVHPSILAANQLNATTTGALAQKEFFADYSQRYGNFSGFASYAADALKIIVAAIEKANSTDRDKVRDALETLTFDGLTGSYTFSATNHGGVSEDALTVLAVRNGTWVLAQ